MSDAPRHRLLASLFDAHFDALLAYTRRRTRQLADAEDAVAETFVIAWRRLDDAPEGRELPWLYAIARRVLSNQRRGDGRRLRLETRMQAMAPTATAGEAGIPEVLDALERLPATDREVLRLAAWEGLTPIDIAAVLGISANAAAIRLHRARGRLERTLEDHPSPVKGFGRARTWLRWKGSAAHRSPKEDTR